MVTHDLTPPARRPAHPRARRPVLHEGAVEPVGSDGRVRLRRGRRGAGRRGARGRGIPDEVRLRRRSETGHADPSSTLAHRAHVRGRQRRARRPRRVARPHPQGLRGVDGTVRVGQDHVHRRCLASIAPAARSRKDAVGSLVEPAPHAEADRDGRGVPELRISPTLSAVGRRAAAAVQRPRSMRRVNGHGVADATGTRRPPDRTFELSAGQQQRVAVARRRSPSRRSSSPTSRSRRSTPRTPTDPGGAGTHRRRRGLSHPQPGGAAIREPRGAVPRRPIDAEERLTSSPPVSRRLSPARTSGVGPAV